MSVSEQSVSQFTFRPLRTDDLPLMYEWLSRSHVAEWWGTLKSRAAVREEYMPAITGTATDRCYLAFSEGTPVGFIQYYTPAELHEDGWWLDENDPGVRGIDQFLADSDQLGRGIGTAMVRAFVAQLFSNPTVTRIQADPSPTNHRAIRCYEKAGFHPVGVIETPDGPAQLMYCDRP